MRLRIVRALAVAALMALPNVASAHLVNYGAANSILEAQGHELILDLEGPSAFVPAGANAAEQAQSMAVYVAERLQVWQLGQLCPFRLVRFEGRDQSSRPVVSGVFECSQGTQRIEDLRIHSAVFDEGAANFNHFMVVKVSGKAWSLAFTAAHQDYPATVQAAVVAVTQAKGVSLPAQGFWPLVGQFIGMGVLHIWTGYDHMLFLLAVVLLVRRPKKLLLLISTFTLAHSVTLVLAGLHIVTLSSRVVEPLIAVSIVYMAVRNIVALRRRTAMEADVGSEQVATTAGFGLVHGLGFAGALVAAQIPSQYVVPALLSFNVGVEVGQLWVLLVLLPLLVLADRLPWRRQLLLGVSMAIAVVASIWVVQRLV